MGTIPKSFVREILKVTQDPEIISFAGGLPNPRFFPTREIAEAAANALAEANGSALQYGTTEGYAPLREYIADRYRRNEGLNVTADEILITNGSQQGLDLIGKAFLDKQDAIVIEQPGYLGAIQAFSAYEPRFHSVPLQADGVDIDRLAEVLRTHRVKFFHTVINFQNPSGISYSESKRAALADVLKPRDTPLIEDDPYKELHFEATTRSSMRKWLGDRAVLLGSFSKIVAPGLRMGWVCAARETMEKLVVAKQASDLHSNSFCQRMLHRYLVRHDIDRHIATIRAAYKRQKETMLAAVALKAVEPTRMTRVMRRSREVAARISPTLLTVAMRQRVWARVFTLITASMPPGDARTLPRCMAAASAALWAASLPAGAEV